MTNEQREAIKVIAKMVQKTHAYDYVDDSVEIRLYGEARALFTKTLYPELHICGIDGHVYLFNEVLNGEPIEGSICSECLQAYSEKEL